MADSIQEAFEKAGIKKAINPDIVEKQVDRPKRVENTAAIRHTQVTENRKLSKQRRAKRKDQLTDRKASRRGSRAVSDIGSVLDHQSTLKARVEKRAYEIWEQSGKVHGRDTENWLQAKRDLTKQYAEEIYRSRESRQSSSSKILGDSDRDWFKAERRIDTALTDPKLSRRVADRFQRVNKYRANAQAEVNYKKYITHPISTISKDVSEFAGKAQHITKELFSNNEIFNKTKQFFKKNKWAGKATKGLAATIAINLGLSLVRKTFQGPAIPDEYEKGYDIISSYTTDYGSPLKLGKAAHKAIRPYYSSIRSALRTNVKTVVAGNIALQSSKNAIGHTRY